MADFLGESGELEPASDDLWGRVPTLDPWMGGEESKDPEDMMERGLHGQYLPGMRLSPFDEDDEEIMERQTDSYAGTPTNPVLEDFSSGDDHLLYSNVPEPIRLRGVGGTTMFGLNNRFEDDFPSHLVGKVAPEEFHATMERINSILYKSVPFNLKLLICGCLCCCCTLGMSLGPVLYLSKRTQSRLNKVIAQENWRLYNKLGLNIRLHKEQCDGTNLREYVLHIEFMPKQPLYLPD